MYRHTNGHNSRIKEHLEFDSVNRNVIQNNNNLPLYNVDNSNQFNELLQTIEEQNSNTKFGFYDIYLEFDTKYRDRSNVNTFNSEFKFRISGRKDISTGTKTGIIGLNEPVHNLVQLEVGDFMMPNILKNRSTFNRISMVINEFLGNEVTTKSTTNLSINTDNHFIFDVIPVYNLPLIDDSADVTVDVKYIRLVPVVKSLLFKTPTTETLDQLTISFYINNEKIIFPTDEYKCTLQLGPNLKNELVFPENHGLNLNDTFEINEIDKTDDYIFSLKNNSKFLVYETNNNTSTILPNDINNQNLLKLYDPLNNGQFISFLPSYASYKNVLSKEFNVDYVKDNKTINFLIDGNYHLIKDLPNHASHKYLVQSIMLSINDFNTYNLQFQNHINENINIITKINNNNNLINQAQSELNTSLEKLFTLKSFLDDHNIQYNIQIINNKVVINGVQNNKIDLYIGNKYIFNQTDNSNLNTNGASNIITNDTVFIKKNVDKNDIKISINEIIQVDYNFIQNGTYNINLNNDTMFNTALVLMPSDSTNIIQRLNSNNVLTNTTINYTPEYVSNFIYPITFYVNNYKSTNTELYNFNYNDFTTSNLYYLRQYGSHNKYTGTGPNPTLSTTTDNKNNDFNIKIPKLSFNDTIYEMPFQKYRGYNFDYNVTAKINTGAPTSEKRDALVDVSISPYNTYYDNTSLLKSIIYLIDGSNNPLIDNTQNYLSFDGTPIYNNTLTYDEYSINNTTYQELRPLPYKFEKPYLALKWKHVYKFDFSQLIPQNINYVILELLDSEGIFTSNINTKTFGFYTVEPGSNINTPIIDPSVETPDVSHVTYVINDNGKNYFKINIVTHNILYIDLRELLNKNTTNTNITPTTYDKKYLFGRTFKLYYENTGGTKFINNYSILKLGSLLNINSYYMNYTIESYSSTSPAYNNTIDFINKFEFKPYSYNMQLYYEPSTKPISTHYYKVFREEILGVPQPVLYILRNDLKPAIVYDKVNLSNIFIQSGDKIILDLNHHSNNNNKFKMKLTTTNNISFDNCDVFTPPIISSGSNEYISNYNTNSNALDLSDDTYGLVTDTYNTLNEEYTIQHLVNIPMNLTTPVTIDYVLNYNNNNGPTFNLSFGRNYRINFNGVTTTTGFIKENYNIILKLNNDIYDIFNQPISIDNINSIIGVTYDSTQPIGSQYTYSNFQYNSINKFYFIQIELNSTNDQYFQFDLRYELFNIDYEQLHFEIYLYNKIQNIAHNNIITNVNLINYKNIINLTNLQDEFSKSLEYNDTQNPILELFYTSLANVDSGLNNIFKFQKESNRKKMYMSSEDNYNDYIFFDLVNNVNVEAKNIYKLHISDDLSTNATTWNKLLSTYRLQKMTGNNRDRFNNFNKYFSDIDLFYSYTYYIDFTEYTSYLFKNFLTDYNTILNTNNAVIEIYTDSNLNDKYTFSNNLLSETYDQASDKYNYFSSGLPSPLPIVKYKLIITNDVPNRLYYGISFIENPGTPTETKITIKGGVINIHNVNINLSDSKSIGFSNNADNTIILYKNSEFSDELLKCKSYFMYIDNLFDDNINHNLHQLNEYQNAIELYYETPKLDEYDFYLKRNENYKDSTYDLSYKSLQNKITTTNNTLYKDIKGFINVSIQVISTLIDPADLSAGVTLINSNVKYTKTDVYLIAGNTYIFNLDDSSNSTLSGADPSFLGNLILETANGIIDMSTAITVNPGSTYILSKNKLKFLGGQPITTLPLINTFSLNVSDFMVSSGDFIIYYYENHPNQKGKIYMNGTKNGNITTQAKDQEALIQKLKDSQSSNVNLFDVYENQKLLENISNNMLKLDGYKYNIELSKLKRMYNDMESEKTKNNNILLKLKNKILINTEKLSSLKSNVVTDVDLLYNKNKFVTTYQNLLYELINNNYFFNNNYIVTYETYLYQNQNTNDGYYIHIDNKYDNRFNNNYKGSAITPKYYTHNLTLHKDNLYIFKFNLNNSDILRKNSGSSLITNSTSTVTTNITYLKLYKKVIDENNVRFIELINNNNDDQYIYINKFETNISVNTLNTVSVFIPFNSDISELYYGVTDSHNTINPTFNTLNSSLGKISFEYTDNDLESLYNANYIINNDNNSFILQEFNNNVQKYTMIKLDNDIYNKNSLITNITNKLNDSSQYNFKYDVINDNNIDINLKIKLKTDYIKILVQFSGGAYVINTIDTNNINYFNKALNGNESLYVGNKYLFDYSLLKTQQPTYEFHIYLDANRTKKYNSSYYFNDFKNNKIYIEITENTPDILYYGFNNSGTLFGKEIYTQTYENIINVKYDTNAYLLQFHYTYDATNNINIPFYKQSDLLRVITDTNIPGYHVNSNFALKINEYYIFDYSHESIPNDYQFNLYSDAGLTTIYNTNVENDIINRKLKIYITNQTTSLGNLYVYYGGVNNLAATINGGKFEIAYNHNTTTSDYNATNGFKIRFDMDNIYDEVYSTNNINFYNSIYSDYNTLQTYNSGLVNTNIIIKRPCQIVLSNEFISQTNINVVNKETNYIVYLYSLTTNLHAVIREYNSTTKQYDFINTSDIIVSSTLPANIQIIYLTKLNDSFYDKNDYLNTPQTIYNSKYLISYDDDTNSYYHILNVAINYTGTPSITTTLLDVNGVGNKIKTTTTNNCRVSNNNINNNYEPISINDTSASNSTNNDHKRFLFAILFDLDKKFNASYHTFHYLYYDEINNNIVFASQNLNINNTLQNLITEPNLLLFSSGGININNVVFEGVSSVIDLNQSKLIYTFRYLSNSNYHSSYIVSINLTRTNYASTDWNIICNEATGVYKYSSVNGNSAIMSYNTNSFIWTGRKYINSSDTNRPLDTVFKIFESTNNNLVQRYPNPNLFINDVDNEDKTLFNFIDNNDNNTISSDVIYGNTVPNSTKILLIQSHSNKRTSYEFQSFINVKTVDINTSLVDGYYTIKLINDNIKIDDRNFIIDNVGNHVDVINSKASNAKYDMLYGYNSTLSYLSVDQYQYPIANFKFTDYNIYKFYISSLFETDESTENNILSYVFIDDVLEYDNHLFTMNKNFLGVSPYKNTPSTYNYSHFWLSDNNIFKLSKYNIDNTNINFNHFNINTKILDLTKQIDDDFNEYIFYKNQANLLISMQNQIGYDSSATPTYQNLYNDINVIGVSINSLLTTSDTNVDNYIKKQEGVTTSDTFDIQIQEAENVYKSLVTNLVISTNLLESYKTALNTLLVDMQKSNSVSNINNIAYYANKYITTNAELTLLNTLINEKNTAIDSYNNDNINYNLTYYNNLSKISENQSSIDIKNTIINDGLNTAISNIYNQYKLSGFDNNLIDPIYLQNIVRNNVSVYVPNRRFKIPMTLRIVIKDRITNYLKLNI